jgi:diguanylate cyclase (GGDEF)-like protein
MAANLDLATILLLLKTSYLAGGTALAYVRRHSRDGRGTGAMAAGFLVQAFGSTLAGMAEVDQTRYAALSLASLTIGLFGYALLVVGACELSSRRRLRWAPLVHLVPVVVLAVALATDLHTRNALRATVFNGVGAAAYLLLAVRFLMDRRAEPLPARTPATLVFAAVGLTCLVLAVQFATGRQSLMAPTTGFILVVTLKLMIALFAVILVLERSNRQLDRLAHTDVLTGIANRRAFYDAAPAAPRADDAVVLFDADRFKRLNDEHGHAFGDVVLCAIAADLAAAVGGDDVVARFGGEEFILFLPGAGAATALAVAERARAAVAATEHRIGDRSLRVGVSAGIAVCPPDAVDLATLIRRADAALYAAKREGGDRCRLHDPASEAAGDAGEAAAPGR